MCSGVAAEPPRGQHSVRFGAMAHYFQYRKRARLRFLTVERTTMALARRFSGTVQPRHFSAIMRREWKEVFMNRIAPRRARQVAVIATTVAAATCVLFAQSPATSRDAWQRPDDIVAALALTAGSRVADVGAVTVFSPCA